MPYTNNSYQLPLCFFDDLHSRINFNEEIHKANYPKGFSEVYKIINTILTERKAIIKKKEKKVKNIEKKICTRFN